MYINRHGYVVEFTRVFISLNNFVGLKINQFFASYQTECTDNVAKKYGIVVQYLIIGWREVSKGSLYKCEQMMVSEKRGRNWIQRKESVGKRMWKGKSKTKSVRGKEME